MPRLRRGPSDSVLLLRNNDISKEGKTTMKERIQRSAQGSWRSCLRQLHCFRSPRRWRPRPTRWSPRSAGCTWTVRRAPASPITWPHPDVLKGGHRRGEGWHYSYDGGVSTFGPAKGQDFKVEVGAATFYYGGKEHRLDQPCVFADDRVYVPWQYWNLRWGSR